MGSEGRKVSTTSITMLLEEHPVGSEGRKVSTTSIRMLLEEHPVGIVLASINAHKL